MDLNLLLAAAGLVFAGVVKGTVGFGLPMIAAPVLAGFIGPRTAVVVMSLVNVASAALIVGRAGAFPMRAHLSAIAPLGLTTLGGVLVGAQLLAVLSPVLLSALVGISAVAFALLSAVGVQLTIPRERRNVVGVLIGLGAGLLAGTTSIFGPPMVMYLHALEIPKRDFVVLLNILFGSSTLVQIASYAALGLYTGPVLESAALTGVCVLVGVGFGFLVQDRVNQRLFNRFVIGVIFLVGLNLLLPAFR
jgi:hypothetical protein